MKIITSTYSVAGRCSSTGALGAIVTSSSPAVGARCAWVKTGTGVVLSQNITDPRLADIGMVALEKGFDARFALEAMKAASPFPEHRQLAAVDADGGSCAFTGKKALGTHSDFCSDGVACVGNLLSDPTIPEAMARHFSKETALALPERLISAMEVGFRMGGEVDQERSIALLVHTDVPFAYVDLRVDYGESPLDELKRLWELYGPQADDYKRRALAPEQAPSFGVKGDE
jgi:uncharacterized Ntn-hydrolase superfamily protein